jgi:hypothetical protein
MKRDKPYEVRQGGDGLFAPAGDEPNNSPNVQVRMAQSMYDELKKVCDGKFAPWLRQAIKEKLERDQILRG